MALSSLFLALTLCLLPPSAAAQDAEPAASAEAAPTDAAELRPTLAEIFRPPTLHGLRPNDAQLSPSGAWITWAWTDEHTESPERHLWIARRDGSDTRRLYAHADEAKVAWHPTEDALLVRREGWLFRLDPTEGARPEPVLELGELGRYRVTADGELIVANVGEEQQIWVVELATGRQWRAAEGLNNRSAVVSLAAEAPVVALFADAAHEADSPTRELRGHPARDAAHEAGRDDERQSTTATPEVEGASDASNEPAARRLWIIPLLRPETATSLELPEPSGRVNLSADGRWVLRRRSQYDHGRDLIMADYLSDDVRSVDVRDSLAGDDGTQVEISLHAVADGSSWTPPLSGASHWYLRGEHFAPTGNALLVDLLSNDFKVRQLVVIDPTQRRVRVVAREYDPAWIGAPFWWSGWQDAETVLYTSEASGFNHLYRVPAAGGEAEPLTAGAYELRDLCEHALRTGRVGLVSTHPQDPATHRGLVLDLETGGRSVLTLGAGVAKDLCLSSDGQAAKFLWSTLGRPGDLCTRRLSGAARGPTRPLGEVAVLTDTIPAAFHELALPAPEIVSYTNPDDGVRVHAYLYRPEPFDPNERYPAVIFVHGAGSLQQVQQSTSSYEPNMLFHQRLARRGFFVLDPDFRHSTGYGRDFRAGIYGFMGGKDLDDVVAGVDYLETLGTVDTSRVGLYGGSYGGFLTLMALFTKPEVFAAGAALRSVTDWRKYNHWYTDARLGDPVKDAENYARSSPIDHVDGLEDPLLILHGLKDSNVFAQDSIRLIEALIERGKDFDAMLYPSQGHGFTDPASWIDEYRRIEELFVEVLQPEG